MTRFAPVPRFARSLVPVACAGLVYLGLGPAAHAGESHQQHVTMAIALDLGPQGPLTMKSIVSSEVSPTGHSLEFFDGTEIDLSTSFGLSPAEVVSVYETFAADLEDPAFRQQAIDASLGLDPNYVEQLEHDAGILDPALVDVTEMLDQLRRFGQVEVYELPLIFDMDVLTDMQHFAATSRHWAYDAMVGFGGWGPADPLPEYREYSRYVNDPDTGAVIDTIETRYYDVNGGPNSGDVMRKIDGQWVKIGDEDEDNDGVRDNSLWQKVKDFVSGKKKDGNGNKKNGLIWMPYFLTSTSFINDPYYGPAIAANVALAQLEQLGTLSAIESYVTQQHLANHPVDSLVIEQLLQSSFAPTVLAHDGVVFTSTMVFVAPLGG